MAIHASSMKKIDWVSSIRTTAIALSIFGSTNLVNAQVPKASPPNSNAKKTAPKAVTPIVEPPINSELLPSDYIPPPEKLPIYDLAVEQPILTEEERALLAKDASKFSSTKNACDTTAAGQKIVENTIRYRLSEMTLKKKIEELPKLRRILVEQIQINSGKRPEEVRAMTSLIGQAIVKQTPELLKNQYIVRIQAAELLGEIDYAPAHAVLLDVIRAKDIKEDEANGQPEGVKIAAAKSLVRLLRFSGITVRDRMTVALAVTKELENPNSYRWLQFLYIECLRYCEISGIDSTNNDKPFVVETLMSVIKDEKRPWRVRSRACYAIGRVPLPKGGIKPDDVVTAVTECALQISNAAAAKPNDPEWKNCIFDIYLAFHKGGTTKDPDLDAEKKTAGGLLEKIKPIAQKAYEAVVPIVNDIFSGKAPDAGNLRNLSEFVRSRQAKVGTNDQKPVR